MKQISLNKLRENAYRDMLSIKQDERVGELKKARLWYKTVDEILFRVLASRNQN